MQHRLAAATISEAARRITSYNVCYTKLLRLVQGDLVREFRPEKTAAFETDFRAGIGRAGRQIGAFNRRAGSYNFV